MFRTKLYNTIADSLLWVLLLGDKVEGIHYVDNFLLFDLPESLQCEESVSRVLAVCDLMGVPVAPAKTEGSSTRLVFLGIELDTASLTLSLPQLKLDHL